jgi:hypothetical protein
MVTKFVEITLLLLVLAPLAMHKPLVQLFHNVGMRYRVFVAGLVFLAIAGHATSFNTFPFVKWNMYGWPRSGDPVVYEYTCILQSGKEVPLVASRLLFSMDADRIVSRLSRQIKSLKEEEDPVRRAELRTQSDEILAALARLQTRKFPADPVRRVIVSGKTIHVRPQPGVYESDPEEMWHVDIREVTP